MAAPFGCAQTSPDGLRRRRSDDSTIYQPTAGCAQDVPRPFRSVHRCRADDSTIYQPTAGKPLRTSPRRSDALRRRRMLSDVAGRSQYLTRSYVPRPFRPVHRCRPQGNRSGRAAPFGCAQTWPDAISAQAVQSHLVSGNNALSQVLRNGKISTLSAQFSPYSYFTIRNNADILPLSDAYKYHQKPIDNAAPLVLRGFDFYIII